MATITRLREQASSSDATQRRAAAVTIGDMPVQSLKPSHLAIVETLLGDRDNDVRWQAAIAIGQFIDSRPDEVWHIVLRFSATADDDMIDALATVLLEHLLEHNFDECFDRLKKEIASGRRDLIPVVQRCGVFGEATDEWHRIDAMLASFE